jgi:hypothetical protein
MTEPKEPHYFSRLTDFEGKRPWYESLFAGAGGRAARGEGSTSYTHPHRIELAAPRIRRIIPDCRLIYMVRHPVRRLESDWKMRLREGRVPASISDAAEEQASLIWFGRYWQHLSIYRALFPDSQILVVFLEDFSEHPARELARVFRHIGVAEGFVPADADRPRMASKDFRRDGALAAFIRRLPGFAHVKGLLPHSLGAAGRKLLTRREPPAVVRWEASALRSVVEYYREDAQQLLRHCGKPAGFWEFDV